MKPPDPSQVARIRLKTYGKVPKSRYGERVYKCGGDLVRLLEHNEWEVVHRGREYLYMRCPETLGPKAPFELDVRIPERQQIEAMAAELHDVGKQWSGYVGDWPAWYLPSEDRQHLVEIDRQTRRPVSEPETYISDPEFYVGAAGVWSAGVHWRESTAVFFEHRECVVGATDSEQLLLPDPDRSQILEGAVQRVATTRYERDPKARTLCLNHHGARCTVCGFDFESSYGPVGRGFIHVHHLTQLSHIRTEYRIDPISDLIPVCPNCHSVIHLRNPPYTPQDVRVFIASSRHGKKP